MNTKLKRIAFVFLLAFAFAQCKQDGPSDNMNNAFPEEVVEAESKKANAFFDRVFDEIVDRSPEYQSYLGIKEDYGEWDDMGESAAKSDMQFAERKMQEFKDSIEFAKLDEPTKISYELFRQYLQRQLDDYQWRNYSYPAHQMRGKHSNVPAFLINIHKVESYDDALAYLSRLEGVPELIDQLIEKIRRHEKAGVVPPRFVFDYVLDDARNVISGKPFPGEGENPVYSDFVKKVDALDIKDSQKKALKIGCEKRLMSQFQPAYQKFIRFMQQQQQTATTDDGVWKFPKGEEYYAYRLKKMTSTDMTADEIHELGLAEVARIHGEMKGIMKKVGFEGSLQDFFAFMKDDPQFYYSNNEEGKAAYMEKATAIIDGMRGNLDKLFHTKPKAELVVKAVEPFREKSAGKAFYQSGAPDGSRPGTYYANTYDMSMMPKYQMEALAYHEGIPGHHMQLSIAQEMQGMPKFRKYGSSYTAYVEGWGLYSEWLPKEVGAYGDPYSDFGRLAMELWRACRLVVDTGIHAKKWTRQEGIDYYKKNTPNAELDCIKMVERHIVMPGQATAYKIGMIKIMELRERAEKALGDQFDQRAFHDVVLTNGAIPLDLLEDLVDEWVASKG